MRFRMSGSSSTTRTSVATGQGPLRRRPATSDADEGCSRNQVAAATVAAAGIVSTHAQTMRPATPQRTADSAASAPDADDRAGDRVRRARPECRRSRYRAA